MILIVFGLVVGAGSALWIMKERAQWLASLEFELKPPPVPASILSEVRKAESRSYQERSVLRRLAEEAQDVLVFASPEAAYRLNFSVGRYHIKAKSIEAILPWAIEQRFVVLEDTSLKGFAHALAYFSEQPGLNDWQAAVYLQWLKQDHPIMADLAWSDIAAQPELVAKLYSGYMGAGGAWDLWRENLTPGAVARQRLGLQ
ncbi:MAG: hypothetical protein V2I76_02835 [Roseobacter sp.]|jgi:hypothetical protein|nr:hypothetical protein [Roseobacter sp.]